MITYQLLKPSQIKAHKLNPRRDVGDLDELAASIKAKGIVEPLIVASNGTDETYVLVAGHRRLAAAKLAKCKTVPCLVRDDLSDPKDQLEHMLIENLQRTDLTPIEEAEAYQQLLAFPGYTQKRIVETTGRAAATVRGRLKLAALPKSALSKIHAGQISLTEATALVEFAGDNSYAALERAAGTDRFAYDLARARETRTRLRRAERTRKELADADVRVIEALPRYSDRVLRLWDDAIEAHRTCEGFAAYIESYSGLAQYVCDKPELHAGDEPAADEPITHRGETPELLAAAEARRRFLAGVLRAADEDMATAMLREHAQKDASRLPWIATLLRLDTLAGKKDLDAAIDKLDMMQLTVLLDVVDHSNDERTLEQNYGWGQDGYSDYTKKWRARLVEVYGYEWTDVELEAIAAGEKARDDRAAGAAADAEGDDDDADGEAS